MDAMLLAPRAWAAAFQSTISTVRCTGKTPTRRSKAYFKGNPLMLGLLNKLFPEMLLEQVKKAGPMWRNLGLFWEVMAPVFCRE